MSGLPTDVKVLRVQLRQARDDAAKAGAIAQASADLYHSALTRIFNLAQEEERRQKHMAGIDLSGRPA